MDNGTQDETFRLNMVRQADRVVEALARQMGVPDATAQDAVRRLRLKLLRRFKTSHDAVAFNLFWRDMHAAARRAIEVEIRARKRAVRRTLLAGVDDEECERILALPGVGKPPRRFKKPVDLVAEFEKIRARSFQERMADELRRKGYRPHEIALILGTTKKRLKEIA